MKNGLLVLNIILLIAVAILFYLQFSSKNSTGTKTANSAKLDSNLAATPGAFKIGYFEMDSIENNFDMVKDVKGQLNRKEDSINGVLANMDKANRDKAAEYQNKAATMTQAQADIARNDMMERQRSFDAQKQQGDQEYKDYYMHRMQDVRTRIEDFLKGYNQAKGYSYIVSYEPGLIYFKDPAYDITADVVKGLNSRYKNKK
jgi:outer membrane protein